MSGDPHGDRGLRVSFFAQQLGTPYPISDKRKVLQAMEQITPHSLAGCPQWAAALTGATGQASTLSVYPRQSKAVPAFGATVLQRRCRQPWLGAHHLNELTHTLNALVGALWVDHFAVAYHVIANN